MNLVEQMIRDRVAALLVELAEVTKELIIQGEQKVHSTKVADFTTAHEAPKEILIKLGTIKIQLTLLQGIIDEK